MGLTQEPTERMELILGPRSVDLKPEFSLHQRPPLGAHCPWGASYKLDILLLHQRVSGGGAEWGGGQWPLSSVWGIGVPLGQGNNTPRSPHNLSLCDPALKPADLSFPQGYPGEGVHPRGYVTA